MHRQKLFFGGLITSVGLVASLAQARQVTPIAGNPTVGRDYWCFNFPDGANPARLEQDTCDENTMDHYPTWLIDAPMDIGSTAGTRTGQIYGHGTGSIAIQCYADAYTLDGGTGYWTLGERTNAAPGKLSFLAEESTTFSVWVPANGTLHAYCMMPRYTGLSAFKFNP
jgi:hypothetical protein